MVEIRVAKLEDLQDLLDIYNYEVINTVAAFDLNPKTWEERKEWFDAHNVRNHPLIVAQLDERAIGYACLSPYRDKEAYDATVELSVYVSMKYRRRGVAKALMEAILQIAKERKDIHTVISVVTGNNIASIALHQSFGFQHCGVIREAGTKFGELLDIVNLQILV